MPIYVNFIGDARNVYVWFLPMIKTAQFHPNILIDGEIEDRIGLEWSEAYHYVWNEKLCQYECRKPSCKLIQLNKKALEFNGDYDTLNEIKIINEKNMFN